MLVPSYMDLYKPIVEELKRQGHSIHIVFDQSFLEEDYNYPWLGIREKIVRRIKCMINRPISSFWKERFQKDEGLNMPYDFFFCINGCSLNDYFLNQIEKNSPKIRKVLYLWDDSTFYGYFQYVRRFDRVVTFDLEDSKKYHVEFLPIYWTPTCIKKRDEKYTISMIGTNHSNRLSVVQKIATQIQNGGGNFFFKILDTSLQESAYVTHSPITQEELLTIMSQSRCILDTDRPSQTGTTPRLIWALAMGKKVITTNTNIIKMPFYTKEQISVINRDNPIIDLDFVFNSSNMDMSPYLTSLRIDMWVKELLK